MKDTCKLIGGIREERWVVASSVKKKIRGQTTKPMLHSVRDGDPQETFDGRSDIIKKKKEALRTFYSVGEFERCEAKVNQTSW